jgi:hypothetical protein
LALAIFIASATVGEAHHGTIGLAVFSVVKKRENGVKNFVARAMAIE